MARNGETNGNNGENHDEESKNDMGAIVERLRREKSESKITYGQSGYEEGLSWAKSAHYDDFRYVVIWDPSYPRIHQPRVFIYFYNILKQYPLMNRSTHSESCVNDHAEAFLTCWKKAVQEFWYEVQEYL